MELIDAIIIGLVCGFVGIMLGALLSECECPDCNLNCPHEPLQELSELIETVDRFYAANPWNRTEGYMCYNRSEDLTRILNLLDWNASIMIGKRELENGTRKGHAWVNVRTVVKGVVLNIQFGGSRAEYPLLYSAANERKYIQTN